MQKRTHETDLHSLVPRFDSALNLKSPETVSTKQLDEGNQDHEVEDDIFMVDVSSQQKERAGMFPFILLPAELRVEIYRYYLPTRVTYRIGSGYFFPPPSNYDETSAASQQEPSQPYDPILLYVSRTIHKEAP